jgi:tRNA(Arg) A34 adenosine deaminase TadA
MRHSSLITKGGNIINVAHNIPTYNRWASNFKLIPTHASLHAEIGALLGLSREVTTGADLYVVYLHKDSTWGNSKPCSMCQQAITMAGIRRVYYTFNNTTLKCVRVPDFETLHKVYEIPHDRV